MILILTSLTACSKDKYSKEKLCSVLEKDYSANLDFVISHPESNITGKASLSKGNITTLTFTFPEEYEGISVTSDETGNPDVFSMEFSGIPATIPKNIASELSLLFSLFSDSVICELEGLEDEYFKAVNDDNCEVFFEKNGFKYKISYNKSSGIPCAIEAGNDSLSVSVIISDFSPIQNK